MLRILDTRRHRVPPLPPCLQDSVVALDIVTDELKANCKVRPHLIYLLGQVRQVSCEILEVLNNFPIKEQGRSPVCLELIVIK